MADYTKYTKQEMQAYAIAKNIKENQIVIVGTGLPLIGASLAKRVVCPSCHPIVESGLMDCSPIEVPRSVGDNRFMAHCAVQWPNVRFVGFEANEWQRGRRPDNDARKPDGSTKHRSKSQTGLCKSYAETESRIQRNGRLYENRRN